MRRRRICWSLILILGSIICASQEFSAKSPAQTLNTDATKVLARENLVAWCIVPFDAKKRGPEDRVAMLKNSASSAMPTIGGQSTCLPSNTNYSF